MASRVALITGCSTGIGLETALTLASRHKEPLTVYATMRNLASKETLEQRAEKQLDKSLFIRQLDVTKENTITDVVSHIKAKHGRLDVLVNNAGIAGICILEATKMETFRKMFDTNFFGAVRLTQEVLPLMKKQRSGKIINISSIAGFGGFPFYEMYGSSKFALEGFSESLAIICRRFNIWVSSVQPGPVLTAVDYNPDMADTLNSQVDDELVDEETRKYFRERQQFRAQAMLDNPQMPGEVAEVIEGIVDSEKPHLIYQTSEMSRELARDRAQSRTGDEWIERFM